MGSDVRIEILKRDPNEFGGIQFRSLTPEEIVQRTCAAKFCSWRGRSQVQIPSVENFPTFRVYCGPHWIKIQMMTAVLLGDPSPFEEARQLAEKLNIDWGLVASLQPKDALPPEAFICATCAGGMIVETVGMFTGKRYIHTCGS